MPKKTKPEKRKYEKDEPVSLQPLTFEQALKALISPQPEGEAEQDKTPTEPVPADS